MSRELLISLAVVLVIVIAAAAYYYYTRKASPVCKTVTIGTGGFSTTAPAPVSYSFGSFPYTTMTIKSGSGLITEVNGAFANRVLVQLMSGTTLITQQLVSIGLVGSEFTEPPPISFPPFTGPANLTLSVPSQSGYFPGISFTMCLS